MVLQQHTARHRAAELETFLLTTASRAMQPAGGAPRAAPQER
jgi:hypothetical protein